MRGQRASQTTVKAGAAWRYWLVLGALFCCVLALFYRAVQLHVLEQGFLSNQGDARAIRFERLDAHRGLISDRNGEPLAISAAVETVYANPQQMNMTASTFTVLAKTLDVDRSNLEAKLLANIDKQFVYLKRKLSPEKVAQVLQLNLEGVYSRREYKRFYPAGEVAAHVVGFADIDERGREGLELSYDDWLTGHEGKQRVMKNRTGKVVKDLGVIEFAEPGKDIQLSLDMRIQYLAYREMKAVVEAHKAKSGSAVVLDVKTGEVLAMVNQPSYNPNNRRGLAVASLRNRAITDVFEPGSTMKLATLSAALESKRYTLSSVLDTSPGYLRLGRKTIRDARNYGRIDLSDVIAKSSNVGVSKIALSLQSDAMWDMFYRLGLGQGTGIGFPGESIGHLPDLSANRSIEIAAMSYGYGLHVNALQLAQAYMILGNGGLKYPLSLIKKEQAEVPERVISEEVSDALRTAMRKVVAKGSGRRARVAMYEVGGKTGTVHRVGRGGYKQDEYKAIFAGLAPIDDPHIAVVVVVDAPSGAEYYGGEVAAPVFSRVVDGTMRLLSVEPSQSLPIQAAKHSSLNLSGGRG
jgi:cell division protein FtsI (penicillin-binding protein 3)